VPGETGVAVVVEGRHGGSGQADALLERADGQ